MLRPLTALLLAALFLPGCIDESGGGAPRDLSPPAAPRGLTSLTGDGQVTLRWLANTESDVVGYFIYEGPCASGRDCPYERVGTTSGTSFTVRNLPNGVTAYWAVAAFDRAGNESDLSYEDIFDTPRPAGVGVALDARQDRPATSGWDFSAYAIRAWDDLRTDVYFSAAGGIDLMVTADAATGIQDMGYATTLDAVDIAPSSGWSPTGSVELIVGHNYVVRTRDRHFAKFRVTGLGGQVVFDWAYQVAEGNRELRIVPATAGATRGGSGPSAAHPVEVLTPAGARSG